MNKKYRTIITTFFIAFIITQLPFPAEFSYEAKIMISIAVVAAIFWVTECIPIPLTAMLVILLQGLFNIQPLPEVLSYIAHPVNTLILAGFLIAGSLKKYQLDKRIGLKIITIMGEKTENLILGLMCGTAFLSMWISNTAATAVLLPIGLGVLHRSQNNPKDSNMAKAMVIGIAFAANVGGMGTPLGTPPIPITIAFLNEMAGISVSFLDWMIRAIPIVIVLIPIIWKTILTFYKPEVKEIKNGVFESKQELQKLGRLDKRQKYVLLLFCIAILLWFLDALGFILPLPNNWIYLASLIISIMYIFPGTGVLTWGEALENIDWGIFILIGGGLALGSGLEATGVIGIIVNYLEVILVNVNLITVIAVLAFVTAFSITLFSSLTATSSTFVPVAIVLASELNINPLLLAPLAGIASCFAFLLPTNTAPNAIAYETGFFKVTEMTKPGLVLTIISVIVLVALVTGLWLPLFF